MTESELLFQSSLPLKSYKLNTEKDSSGVGRRLEPRYLTLLTTKPSIFVSNIRTLTLTLISYKAQLLKASALEVKVAEVSNNGTELPCYPLVNVLKKFSSCKI